MVQCLMHNFREPFEKMSLFQISFPIFMRQMMENSMFQGLATLTTVEDLRDFISIWSFDGNFLKLWQLV